MLEKIVLNKDTDTKFDIFEDITARLMKLEGLPEQLEFRVLDSCATAIQKGFAETKTQADEAE